MSSRHIYDKSFLTYVTITFRHVLEDCMAIETVRQREGIRSFLDECHNAGLSSATSYRHYIAGLDAKGIKIDVKDHLSRGGCLLRMTEAWLDIWEPKD